METAWVMVNRDPALSMVGKEGRLSQALLRIILILSWLII